VLGRKAIAVYQYDLPAIHFQRNAYREVLHFANQGCSIAAYGVQRAALFEGSVLVPPRLSRYTR
jgi:hypothetical protein